MKCVIPEISWHNRDPVLSVDFQPVNDGSTAFYRLATGGTDTHVLIWLTKICEKQDTVSLEFVSDLKRHNKAVNVVRFSPSGEFLATGDDEAAIWLWKQQDKTTRDGGDLFLDDDDKENKENWAALRTLRGHIEDVYDLCWSPNSSFLISGSVDNSAIIWDIVKGRSLGLLSDHKGFVQGVAWDPQDQYVATLCSDRVCRIYNITTKKIVQKIYKANLSITALNKHQTEDQVELTSPQKSSRLFHDDTLKSFFRRLVFTPDGELLITPAGIVEANDGSVLNVTHVFSRHSLTKPAFYLPSKDKHTLAVRCCPTLFKLRSNKTKKADSDLGRSKPWELNSTILKLPYRMVFAIATQDSVLFYDTQQAMPFAKVANIQYTRLSDLSWSSDGRILIVSSTDGYCSFVTFNENELGVVYKPEETMDVSDVIMTPESKLANKSDGDLKVTPPASNSTTKTEAAVMTPIASVSKKPPSGCKQVSLITLFSPKSTSAVKECAKLPKENLPVTRSDRLMTVENDLSSIALETDGIDLASAKRMTIKQPIANRQVCSTRDINDSLEEKNSVENVRLSFEEIDVAVNATVAHMKETVVASELPHPKIDVVSKSNPPALSAIITNVAPNVPPVNVSPTVRQPRRVQLVTLSTTPKRKK